MVVSSSEFDRTLRFTIEILDGFPGYISYDTIKRIIINIPYGFPRYKESVVKQCVAILVKSGWYLQFNYKYGEIFYLKNSEIIRP